jgi:hypothetical protein
MFTRSGLVQRGRKDRPAQPSNGDTGGSREEGPRRAPEPAGVPLPRRRETAAWAAPSRLRAGLEPASPTARNPVFMLTRDRPSPDQIARG